MTGRVLGVDLGTRRIGLALTDASCTLASPLEVLVRTGTRAADHQAIVDRAVREGARTIVVGMPRSLSGAAGPAARAAVDEVEALGEVARGAGCEVDTYDERFTTVIAERQLTDARGRRKDRRRQARTERRSGGTEVDAAAAAVILQSWLDARRSRP